MIMIQKLKLAGMAAVVSAIAVTAQAQVVTNTNAVQTLTFALTAYYQGATTTVIKTNVTHMGTNHTTNYVTTVSTKAGTVTINTADIIAALGKAIYTNSPFSKSAQLLHVNPIIGSGSFIVRDVKGSGQKKTTNIVDVTPFFSYSSTVGDVVVDASRSTNDVTVTDTEYKDEMLSLAAPSTNFTLTTTLNLTGFEVETQVNDVVKKQVIDYASSTIVTVIGTGTTLVGTNTVPTQILIDGSAGKSTLTISAPKFVVGPASDY